MNMQVEAGIQGQSPGPSTEKFLTRKMKAVRFWGALSVAVLAVGAQFYDQYCMEQIGTSISSLSLLLVVGLITSCIRQVCFGVAAMLTVTHPTHCLDNCSLLTCVCVSGYRC